MENISSVNYFKTKNARWYWIVLFFALMTIFVVNVIPEDSFPFFYFRYFFGGVFVLWLPGYTFIKALFSKREFDILERIALNIGMSLALVPSVVLLLNYTSWGITTNSVTFSLLALSVILATISILREYRTNKKTIPNQY